MVLNARDIDTNQATPVFCQDSILLTKRHKLSNEPQSVAFTANSSSTLKIDCRQYKAITLYGTSTTNNIINIEFSHDNITFFKTSNKLSMLSVAGLHTFSVVLDHLPNYIRFYNDNGVPITLNLSYVLYN